MGAINACPLEAPLFKDTTMSDFKNDPGFGQLFRNKYKDKDSQPDHKGSMTTPDGHEWDISAWVKDGKNGKFFSLSIQEKWVKPDSDESKPAPEDFDDDIPF